MREIKLRKSNSEKYCGECRKKVGIVMKGLNGHCPECETRLYTLDNRPPRNLNAQRN